MFSRSDGAIAIGIASLTALFIGVGLLLSAASEELPSSTHGLTPQNHQSPIDLNHASMVELMELPGIGPVLAERIVRFRLLHGPFHSVEQLLDIQGIGPQTLERLRPWLRLCTLPPCDF